MNNTRPNRPRIRLSNRIQRLPVVVEGVGNDVDSSAEQDKAEPINRSRTKMEVRDCIGKFLFKSVGNEDRGGEKN